jgi:hypothetical protein
MLQNRQITHDTSHFSFPFRKSRSQGLGVATLADLQSQVQVGSFDDLSQVIYGVYTPKWI